MREGWQYFSGHLRAFLRRTRLFRWSSFDCRDLYERSDQIRLTPIRLGIGSAGCASHSSAKESPIFRPCSFPTFAIFVSRFSLFCLFSFSSEYPESFLEYASRKSAYRKYIQLKINTACVSDSFCIREMCVAK